MCVTARAVMMLMRKDQVALQAAVAPLEIGRQHNARTPHAYQCWTAHHGRGTQQIVIDHAQWPEAAHEAAAAH